MAALLAADPDAAADVRRGRSACRCRSDVRRARSDHRASRADLARWRTPNPARWSRSRRGAGRRLLQISAQWGSIAAAHCGGELARICDGHATPRLRSASLGQPSDDRSPSRIVRSGDRLLARSGRGSADMTVASIASRAGCAPAAPVGAVGAFRWRSTCCFIAGALWIRVHGPPPPMSPGATAAAYRRRAGARPAAKDGLRPICPNRAFSAHAADARGGRAAGRKCLVGARQTRRGRGQSHAAVRSKPGSSGAALGANWRTATLSFLATLSPEQRAKFVELARQRPWAKRHQDGAP